MRQSRLLAATVWLLGSLIAVIPTAARAGDPLADQLERARSAAAASRLEEAIDLAEEALAASEARFGRDHPNTGAILLDLAAYLARQNRWPEARHYLERCAKITATNFGEVSREYATVMRDLGRVLRRLGVYDQALTSYERSHRAYVRTDGANGANTAYTANEMALLLLELNRFEEAERYLLEAEIAYRNLPNASAKQIAPILLNLVDVYLEQGRMADARRLAADASATLQRSRDSPIRLQGLVALAQAKLLAQESRLREAEDVLNGLVSTLASDEDQPSDFAARVLHFQGYLYLVRGLYVEAEPVLRRALDTYSRISGPDSPAVGRILHNLAIAHLALGNSTRAKEFYERAIQIFAKTFGEASTRVATTAIELAFLEVMTSDFATAAARVRRAIRVFEDGGAPQRRLLGLAHVPLAMMFNQQGRHQEAILMFERVRRLISEADGDRSHDLYLTLIELGRLYTLAGRYKDAEESLAAVIEILRRDQALTPRKLPRALRVMADLRAVQGRQQEALQLSRESTELLLNRAALAGQSYSDLETNEQRTARELYAGHVALAYAASTASADEHEQMIAEAFEVAQLAQVSTAAQAIRQVAARFAGAASGPLADAIRTRQDAIEEWRHVNGLLTDSLAGAAERTSASEAESLRRRLAALESQLEALDRQITEGFPEFAQISNPLPTKPDQLQTNLRDDEALLLQLTEGDTTYLFLVAADRIDAVRSELSEKELERLVRDIRATVDLGGLDRLPVFDVASAHALYRLLLGPLEVRLGRVKHLIFVPDGAMQSLPPALLLERPVDPKQAADLKAYPGFPWLGRRFAISVLPSVSSLYALRSIGASSKAANPLAGFGDPTLGKGGGTSRSIAVENAFPEGLGVDRSLFRLLEPLPETATELERMRAALGGQPQHVYLGQRASEREVKSAPLAQFRVVVFATHALVAGEFRGLAEPSLILTPPQRPDDADDGLLMASEIARLHLDADWVILSACNTAAPDGSPGADGLSGLAQAFFYAGARSLLVSHWSVASESTVPLTSGTIELLAGEPALPKAEALRRSMNALMTESENPVYAHPAFWAPFVLVGDGWSGIQGP